MAMNFEQLTSAFETYTSTEGEIDAAQLALWMNEALLDLAYDLGPVQVQSIEVVAGETLAANSNWLRLLDCDLAYQRQPDGSLLFTQGGAGRLYYRSLPTLFSGSSDTETSDLHPALHYLPALFAAARYWDSICDGDGGESTLASKWMSYYYQGKNLARARLHCASWDVTGWSVA